MPADRPERTTAWPAIKARGKIELTPFPHDLATPAGRLMAGVLASVASYETEVRKERQLAGIAKAKQEGRRWGGRRPGTRIKLTIEKESLIHQLHVEGRPVAAIARMVGLTRKTVYRAIKGHSGVLQKSSLLLF